MNFHLAKVGLEGRMFITDDWEGFHRLIPQDQLFTGKDLTNIRHYLARFRRRTKIVSKCPEMGDPSLRIHHHLRDPKNYAALAIIFCRASAR